MDKLLKNKLKELGVDKYNMKKITGKKQRPGYFVSVPSAEDGGWVMEGLLEDFDVNLSSMENKIVYKIHRKRGGVGQ